MEELIHTIIGSLHILAAITWVGSMIYSYFAVTPALNKALDKNKAHAVNGLVMGNYQWLTWTSLTLLIATGFYNVFDKADEFTPLSSGLGLVLIIKLILVAIMVIILLLQVYKYGPKMKLLIMPSASKDTERQVKMTKLERISKSMSWLHLVLGITIVILGVILSILLG